LKVIEEHFPAQYLPLSGLPLKTGHITRIGNQNASWGILALSGCLPAGTLSPATLLALFLVGFDTDKLLVQILSQLSLQFRLGFVPRSICLQCCALIERQHPAGPMVDAQDGVAHQRFSLSSRCGHDSPWFGGSPKRKHTSEEVCKLFI